MERKKGCTIKDVAKRANVSTSTVSRALAGNDKISEATKERVRIAAEELGYSPNSSAQALANRSTNTLAVIVPYRSDGEDPFANAYFIKVVSTLSRKAKEKGHYLIYSFSNTISDELDNIAELVTRKRVDGIVLLGTREDDENVEYLLKQQMPFVVVGRPKGNQELFPWVDNDNFRAMQAVVDNLLSEGCRDILFLGGDRKLFVTQDRYRGYLQSMDERSDTVQSSILDLPFSIEGGKRGYLEAMETRTKVPDAIVATDDLIAIGAYQSLQKSDQSKVRIVGFNNTIIGDALQLPIDSVEIYAEKLGEKAIELLFHYMHEDVIANKLVPTKIVFQKK